MKILMHHGILGQKWGQRNGPPYPLGASDHSSRERKAGWRKSLSKSGSENNTKKRHGLSDNDSGKKFANRYMSKEVGYGEEYVVMAVAYLAYLGIMAATAKKREEKLRKKWLDELEDRKNRRSVNSLNDLPKIKEKKSASDSMKKTNPDFPGDGTTVNCTFCTTAMALREKGFDVQAAKTAHPWFSDDLFSKAFNSPEHDMKTAKSGQDVIDELSKCGDGAYGNLSVHWSLGGGHSIFWKNEDGKTHIYDGQSGMEYDVSYPNDCRLMNSITISQTTYNRLDNCDPTEYALAIIEPRKEN